jgi:hypothetical protein
MIRLPVVLAALLAIAAPAHAQRERETVPPPRAMVRQLYADLDEGHDFKVAGIEALAAGITVEPRDLNGDGTPELLVEGTRYCGKNCQRWIYRRLPNGRYTQIHEGGGSFEALPARAQGWRNLSEYWSGGCCDGARSLYVFDGTRYRWRDTRSTESPATRSDTTRTVYHLAIAAPDARGRRRLALDPVDAGGGLTVAARHDVCPRAQAEACGAPRLVLTSARLPQGQVCVRMRVVGMDREEYRSEPGGGWCGVTAPAAGGRRTLVLRPRRADWARLRYFSVMELAGPGLPGRLADDAHYALSSFTGQLEDHYALPCVPGIWCESGPNVL